METVLFLPGKSIKSILTGFFRQFGLVFCIFFSPGFLNHARQTSPWFNTPAKSTPLARFCRRFTARKPSLSPQRRPSLLRAGHRRGEQRVKGRIRPKSRPHGARASATGWNHRCPGHTRALGRILGSRCPPGSAKPGKAPTHARRTGMFYHKIK